MRSMKEGRQIQITGEQNSVSVDLSRVGVNTARRGSNHHDYCNTALSKHQLEDRSHPPDRVSRDIYSAH